MGRSIIENLRLTLYHMNFPLLLKTFFLIFFSGIKSFTFSPCLVGFFFSLKLLILCFKFILRNSTHFISHINNLLIYCTWNLFFSFFTHLRPYLLQSISNQTFKSFHQQTVLLFCFYQFKKSLFYHTFTSFHFKLFCNSGPFFTFF